MHALPFGPDALLELTFHLSHEVVIEVDFLLQFLDGDRLQEVAHGTFTLVTILPFLKLGVRQFPVVIEFL